MKTGFIIFNAQEFFFFYLVINLFFQFLQPDVTLLLTGLGSRNSVPL